MATRDKAKKTGRPRASQPARKTARAASPVTAEVTTTPPSPPLPAEVATEPVLTTSDDAGQGGCESPAPAPSSEPPTVKPTGKSEVEQLQRRILELESELGRRIDPVRPDDLPRQAPARPDEPPSVPSTDDALSSASGELLPTGYYLRHWGRQGLRSRAEEVDDYGLDPVYEARWRPAFDFLYRRYFRVDTEGAGNVPSTGRCLIVSNHSGGPLPYDGIMLRTALRLAHPDHRDLRWLAEDFIYYLPFVGTMMNRLGAVRACQENAARLLAGEHAVAVFPEGAKGIGKLYRDRYKLQRFGRGGFIRLCLRTGTPVIPCAVVGAEEANPMLHRIEYMTKSLGIPYLPVTPTFPLLGAFGLLPAPTKWSIRFGEPVHFDEFGPEAADDELLVGRLAERVRTTIQAMIDQMIGERKSVWFG